MGKSLNSYITDAGYDIEGHSYRPEQGESGFWYLGLYGEDMHNPVMQSSIFNTGDIVKDYVDAAESLHTRWYTK